MSFLKNLFNKSTQKLHFLSLEKKIDFALSTLDSFTSLVVAGIQDVKQLKDSKVFIKNSILFLCREMKRQPGRDYILEKHLNLPTKEKYEQYLDLLASMLGSLSGFSDSPVPDLSQIEKQTDFTKELDAMTKYMQEKQNESDYYYSELDSIENDLKNNTSFKKIKFYDYE